MGRIDGVSGISAISSDLPPSDRRGAHGAGSGPAGHAGPSAGTMRPQPVAGLATPACVPEVASAGPVRPGRLGGDGRFEKFILALQALQLDYGIGGIGASRTDRAERMRAAAEEIFKIDGVPQPVRPAADAAATVPEFQARPVDAAPIGIVSGAELAKPPSATPAAEPGPAATTAVADAPEG